MTVSPGNSGFLPQKPPWPEPTRSQSPIYTTAELGRELRQGEIISHLEQHIYNPVDGSAEGKVHELVIIAAQDCDLLQDFNRRESGSQPDLNGVLLYEVHPATQIFSQIQHGDWKLITQGRHDRYYFLEEVAVALDLAGEGLPEMLVDFKRYFTAPVDEVYRQCSLPGQNAAMHRCRLEMPYREHFQCRVAFYLQRVMLPLRHQAQEVARPKNPPASRGGAA